MVDSGNGNSGNSGISSNDLLSKYLNKGNINVNISKSEMVIFCLTIIFIFLTVFMVCGAFYFGSLFGVQAEKIGWLKDKQMEMIEWQKEIEKETLKENVRVPNKG